MKWMIAMLLVVGLSGCASEAPAEEATGPAPGATADVPEWALADWWTYRNTDGRTLDLVVAEDQGATWTLMSNDFESAYFDYLYDVSFLGPMKKSDLSGKQGSDTIQFFDFPLEHDKTWTTKWDGGTQTVVAHAIEEGKFHMAVYPGSETAGKKFAEYVYDPLVGFFESLIFFNLTSGDVQYRLDLEGNGDNFAASVYRYTDEQEILDVTITSGSYHEASFPISGVSELLLEATFDCSGPGMMGAAIQQPRDDGSQAPTPPSPIEIVPGPEIFGDFGNCPEVEGEIEDIIPNPREGQWRFDGVVANQGSIDFKVVSRTYETLSF